jgi:sugar/nucleoside kinase (ribokinase family)
MEVCVVGHVTKDLIRIPGKPDREMAGGSAFYVSLAMKRFGFAVTVVTKVAATDTHLFETLEAHGVHVINGATPVTTTFENVYTDARLTARRQWVRSIALPFTPRDLQGVRSHAFHIGPLTSSEISIDMLRAIRAEAEWVTFDAQGMLRAVADGAVHLRTWSDVVFGLPLIDILKVDDAEATELVGPGEVEEKAHRLSALGAREVLITRADRGSVVRAGGVFHRIPAYKPRLHVDATGCGDTYAAGYFAARLSGERVEQAARFAAATASLKLERYGAFEGSSEDVRSRIRAAEALEARLET